LLVRPDAAVQLRPKALGVLLLLLRRAGAVVPKEEILATVWEHTVNGLVGAGNVARVLDVAFPPSLT
jgi:DNA-binding response OmpR family regulator